MNEQSYKSIEESVVAAMDGDTPELFQFLPYILQDFWEIGADPEAIINMVQKHSLAGPDLQVLDLGCGKGVVSVKMAQKIGCNCFGIDAVETFVNEAAIKAAEYHVSYLCRFEVNDIRTRVKTLHGFDVIVLGAIGPVLGNFFETLSVLKKCLNPNGIILIDDGYIDDNSSFKHPVVITKGELISQVHQAGMEMIDEKIYEIDDNALMLHQQEFEKIQKRCEDLIQEHPSRERLFRDYIANQQKEYNAIEQEIINALMVFKPM